MKTKRWFALVIALSVAGLCRAALEFSGYLRTEKEFKFVIKEADDNTSSGWIVLGQAFKDYTLVAFDQKKEILSVKNGDSIIELRLKAGHVKEAKGNPLEIAVQLAAAKEELARLRIRYRDGHPTIQVWLKKIAELEAQSAK
jgi:hypothetical protein